MMAIDGVKFLILDRIPITKYLGEDILNARD